MNARARIDRRARALLTGLACIGIVSAGLVGAACVPGEGEPEGTITLPESESPYIAFNIWVKAGSQNDPAGKEGLAALTASLLSDGSTTEDSYEQISKNCTPWRLVTECARTRK